MKSKFLFIGFLMIGVLLSGCKKDDDKIDDSSTDCIVGVWKFTENNFVKSFTFNEDKTGVEVQAADDIRNFTWTMKNDHPVIVYVGESIEWTFDLDCDKNELEIYWAVYKKDL